MSTPNLDFTLLASDTNQPEVPLNEAYGQIDDAFGSSATFTIDNTNALSLTQEQIRRNLFFTLSPDGTSPPTAQITLTVPAVSRGVFIVKNTTGQLVQVERTGQTETPPTIADGSSALLSLDAVDVEQPAGGGGGGGAITIEDEGVQVTAAAAALDFVGGGVTATDQGSNQVQVSIPGVTIQGVQPIYTGALIRLSSNFDPADNTDTVIPWDAQENQQTQVGLKFWLGADLTFTADNTTNRLTATAHGMSTGDGPFEVSSAGTLPTGLTASTNYWCIRVDDNTLQVASSLANAKSGTAVAFTDNGTGIHTINRQNRLVVPDGVTAVEVSVGIAASGDDWLVQPRKNGSLTFNGAFDLGGNTNTSGVNGRTGRTPALVVTAGDYFDFVVNAAAGVTVNTDSATWASIRALQTTTATQPQIVFGGDVLVESRSFTAQSTVTFTDLNPQSGETFYAVIDFAPSTDGVEANFVISDDNGVSFKNSSYHHSTRANWETTGINQGGSNSATFLRLQGTNSTNDLGNAAGEGAHIYLEMPELADTTRYKQFVWLSGHVSTTGNNVAQRGAGAWRGGTTAINAIRFGVSSGTLTGRISIYRRSVTSTNPLGQVLHVQHRVTAGTAGGTPSGTGSWLTRTLNSEQRNAVPGASLASNQISLPPGTYEVDGNAVGYQVGKHQSRLRDTGGASTLLVSTTADAGTAVATETTLQGTLNLTATTTIELQTRVGTAATDGFGSAANFGEDEVYANVFIRKLA